MQSNPATTAPSPLPIGPDKGLITLAEAARRLPRIDGRKVAIPTIWRWCRKGLRGVFLDYIRVGRKICITPDALNRFFTELSALDRRTPPQGRPAFLAKRKTISSVQRQRALAEADRILMEAGI